MLFIYFTNVILVYMYANAEAAFETMSPPGFK